MHPYLNLLALFRLKPAAILSKAQSSSFSNMIVASWPFKLWHRTTLKSILSTFILRFSGLNIPALFISLGCYLRCILIYTAWTRALCTADTLLCASESSDFFASTWYFDAWKKENAKLWTVSVHFILDHFILWHSKITKKKINCLNRKLVNRNSPDRA